MKNLTTRQLVKEFNKFLRENECASKFYVNRAKKMRIWKYSKNERILTFLKRHAPEEWVAAGFTWRRTLQGHDHWENIGLKWGHRLKEIGHKP